MKRHLGFRNILGNSILGGGAIVLLANQPVFAQATQITNVRLNQTSNGVEVILETRNGERPQIFTVNRDNTLIADVINTQLALPEGNGFLQNSPAPGINSVTVSQLDANSVRVAVAGSSNAPTAQVNQSQQGIVLNLASSGAEGTQSAQSPAPASQGGPTLESDSSTPFPVAQTPDVLVPNPRVQIDGVTVPEPSRAQAVPPLLPRAVAPPVGDIAVSIIDTSPSSINLDSAEVVPRLVLRDAPVRDVLSLLARAANLNVAYIGPDAGLDPASATGEAPADVRISLDIENESVQDVFNYVLRISGLEANRTGRTIFVGPQLPNEARQIVTRNLRLNQINVSSALNFLVGLGAETAVSRERQVTFVSAVPVEQATGEGSAITQTQTTTEERLETQRVDFQDSTPILRGLQVIGDERTNSLTLVGSPQKVAIATSQLTQLDVRRRQVAVNVRVIDVDLLATDRSSTSFSFGVGDFRFLNSGGVGIINFGADGITPPVTISPNLIGNPTGINRTGEFGQATNFLAQLQLAVTSGNAKILTDPTLIVQEGQTAEVQLTEEVITNFEIETSGTGDDRQQTVTVERTPAGLILQVQVDRIDDNGFVALSVAPSISAPSNVETVTLNENSVEITLLAERRLTSGQIRVRDGQTLVLSGIIQDSDRATVTKIPILGDLPILGALFRRTARENQRQEVIVLLTPQILNDSDDSTYGYNYVPSQDVQRILQNQGLRDNSR